MDLLVVVSAQLLLLLWAPLTEWLLNISLRVLAADHEADLARWVGRDSGVCVFDDGEDLLARLLQVRDQGKMEPLVLSYDRLAGIHGKGEAPLTTLSSDDTPLLQRAKQ